MPQAKANIWLGQPVQGSTVLLFVGNKRNKKYEAVRSTRIGSYWKGHLQAKQTLTDDPWDIHNDLPSILPVSSINFQPSLIPKGSCYPNSASSRWAVDEWQPCVLYPRPMVFPEQQLVNGALAHFLIFLNFTQDQGHYPLLLDYQVGSVSMTPITPSKRPEPMIHGSRSCSHVSGVSTYHLSSLSLNLIWEQPFLNKHSHRLFFPSRRILKAAGALVDYSSR